MARRTAPQHDITKEGIYVPGSDLAWDKTRIDAEVAELRDGLKPQQVYGPKVEKWPAVPVHEDDPARQHAFWRYVQGTTRYDLDAEGIGEYLDRSKNPEMWRLRRISGNDRSRVQRLWRGGGHHEGFVVAFLGGAVGLDGAESDEGKELARLLEARASTGTRKGRKVTDDEVLAAADAFDAASGLGAGDTVDDVGGAVMSFCSPLTEEEKKT